MVKLADIREEVFRLKPHFGEVVRKWGDKTLLEYYGQEFSNLHEPLSSVLDAIEIETSSIFGDDVGLCAAASLKQEKWVNTADHHGLLCHPYFYTNALARSHDSIRNNSGVTVTLPFGGVSLGNDSFPRGFFFHDAAGKEERIFFKSLKERRMPICMLLPMQREELLHEQVRSHSFTLSHRAHEQLDLLFANLLADERIWNQKKYSAQLTRMNSVLWHTLFKDTRGEFVYLEIDSVVQRLLLEKHLVSETQIFNLIFNTSWRAMFVELFAGVFGSHNGESGTHLFWYIDYAQKTRRSLFILNNSLVTKEGDVTIPITPESIAEGLRTRTLMPSTALTLILIHGVEKLACGGGHSQLTYLSTMMEKWNILLARFSQNTETPNPAIYCGENTLFQGTSQATGKTPLSSCIDILLYSSDISSFIDQALTETSMAATVDAMIPSLNNLSSKEVSRQDYVFDIPKIIIQ